ncbi:MAG: carboxypeptidase-like regulatory domain-containing protein [Terriglobales bacterium]
MRRSGTARLLLLCFALPALALAQLATSTVRGRIIASSGAAIPGAVVTIANRATGKSRVVLADGYGAYALTGLPPGAVGSRPPRPVLRRWRRACR